MKDVVGLWPQMQPRTVTLVGNSVFIHAATTQIRRRFWSFSVCNASAARDGFVSVL